MTTIPRTSGIYKIICIPSNKIYIGSSHNLYKRWRQHCADLRRGEHTNAYLQNAWDKYGSDAFTIEILEQVESSVLIEREQYWIDALSPFDEHGFNIGLKADAPTAGRKASPQTIEKQRIAQLGAVRSLEHRSAISKALKGKKKSPEHVAKVAKTKKGKRHTLESRAKMSIAQKGRKLSPEHIAKRSASIRGFKHTVEFRSHLREVNLGKKHTLEARHKMSIAKKGHKQSSEFVEYRIGKIRRWYVVTSPDEIQFLVNGLTKLCKEYHLTQQTMYKVADGQLQQHKGWRCRHATEEDFLQPPLL